MKNKTYINNFDKSSTGTDIEVYAYYDNGLSRIYFNENFESLTEKRNISIYFYNDCKQIERPNFELEIIGDISNMERFLDITSNENDCDNQDTLKEEYNKELVSEIKDNRPSDYFEIKEYINELAAYNITAKFKENLQELPIRGYSQGDFTTVVYNPDKIEKVWGVAPIESELKTMFENYFFDAPIQAVATINGIEYPYEYDSYDFKRQEFIEYVKKETGVDISDFLPNELDYN